ncbi:hypothetical protein PR003_g750 [Phytophthora rubi]|uniref:Uncharacterized protein n=1 Tax=Phytophthora rubi TaxID=129364 RepID=A0A6A4G2F7_9STRA|nr:hypothetical protein PR001_g13005 [Phytophthora rubi]KAE9048154.1 hypothetical protein PR002_g639 [Phytophthora rubi]KAE9359460.1 hypothetical protein PR003_g750 [Phytophthora rubi]
MAVSRARSSSHRALSEPDGRVRNLQGARYATTDGPSGTRFYEEDESWSPRDEWGEHLHHHHDHNDHEHSDHDHKEHEHHEHKDDNDDDDDSKDDKNDDNDDDEDNSHSGSSSQSGTNATESAAIQSSVVTNLDGINIGNTITIINIGTGTGSQGGGSSSSGSTDYVWNGGPPSHNESIAVSDSARSDITSAAVRAFCESIGCGRSKSFKDTVTGGGSAVMPAFSAGNREAGNESLHETPVVTSSSSAADASLARWLVLIAILGQLG